MSDDDTYKILLIGNSSVGKSSIIKKYINNSFEPSSISTVGVEYFKKTVMIDNKEYTLNIMDTCGQERFSAILPSYFKSADGIIFVFDITNKISFQCIEKWLKLADDNATYKAILVGNKIDLEKIREVNKEEVEEFKEKQKMEYYETSAKNGTNINEIFTGITKILIEGNDIKTTHTFKIGQENKNEKKNNCC